jgi:phenylalanyl-tRNA synthetase beta chain
MELALNRALTLLRAVAGGEVVAEGVDLYPAPRVAPVIDIRPDRASRLLGTEFGADEIVSLLEPIGFEVAVPGEGEGHAAGPGISPETRGEKDSGPRSQRALSLRVPGYRWYDVAREADLIEEVARRYGYDRFPSELRAFRPSAVPDDPMAHLEDRLRTFMVGHGLAEARLAAFVPDADGDVAPLNPLSSAEGRLRRALLPGLIRRVEANFAHGIRSVRLFEIGTVFLPGDSPAEPPREETRIAFVISGATRPIHWSGKQQPYDLWDLKGLLDGLIHSLASGLAIEPGVTERTPLLESSAYRVVDDAGVGIGWAGEVEAAALDAPAWADPLFAGEVVLRTAFALVESPRFQPLPAYPAIERDIALLIADEVPAAAVESAIRAAGGALLEEVITFDLFRGAGIPGGSRSIAYRLRFRAPNRTLADRDADKSVTRVLARLKEELGVERRG